MWFRRVSVATVLNRKNRRMNDAEDSDVEVVQLVSWFKGWFFS
jgi:hypothetical protein